MGEQSHRDEMNAAIRAQRERQAVPRSLVPAEQQPADDAPAPPDEEPRRRRLLDRLRGR
ncbi:MAG: hypothetical protein ACYDCH_10335 [Gaiellaceae bacterium]